MELMNSLDRFEIDASQGPKAALHEGLDILIRVLAPIVPDICHRLWDALGREGELLDARWPRIDPEALVQEQMQLVIQINGKRRAEIEISASSDEQEIEAAVLADLRVSRHLGSSPVKKFVIVPNRLVNIVV